MVLPALVAPQITPPPPFPTQQKVTTYIQTDGGHNERASYRQSLTTRFEQTEKKNKFHLRSNDDRQETFRDSIYSFSPQHSVCQGGRGYMNCLEIRIGLKAIKPHAESAPGYIWRFFFGPCAGAWIHPGQQFHTRSVNAYSTTNSYQA